MVPTTHFPTETKVDAVDNSMCQISRGQVVPESACMIETEQDWLRRLQDASHPRQQAVALVLN